MEPLRDLVHNPVLGLAAGVFATIFVGRAAWAGATNVPKFFGFLFGTLVWTVGVLVAIFIGAVALTGLEEISPGSVPSPDEWLAGGWAPAGWARYVPWA